MNNATGSENYIPLDVSKITIIAGLKKFHPELGIRANKILFDEKRLNIVETPTIKTGMMACRPASITIEDLKSRDMYLPDYEQKFGPSFTQQDNPSDYAIIDYEYVGTPRSAIYLAHELGHAIADDIQREYGRSFRDFTVGQAEEQAYFVQSIVTHYTGEPSEESACKDEVGNDPPRISRERISQYRNAQKEFELGLSLNFDQRMNLILRILGGHSEVGERPSSK